MIEVALYQPDIPQNLGAAIRLCACLNMKLHIIEPCGFPFSDRKIRQSGMDYIDLVQLERHKSWDAFCEATQSQRHILMTTKSSEAYTQFEFEKNDILIAGRESAGVPDNVHESVDHRVLIPMHGQARSLNVINSVSMISGEALRQTGFEND
ncbi:MAG: tRNA (cytidine(34)-2'-O)-methyltransferase [Pseudomonadota bacterium]